MQQMQGVVLGVQVVVAGLYVGYLLQCYAMTRVGWVVRVAVYLTWFLSFGVVVVLPFDVYDSLEQNDALKVVWSIAYYSIFVLTWLLLPVLQEYEAAGELTVRAKLRVAVINNLIIYGVFALIGGFFLVYLLFKGDFKLQELMPIFLAAANAFGMFLVVIFLSYGLVVLPKVLWQSRMYDIKIKQQQFNAAHLHKRKETLLHDLEHQFKELLWYEHRNGLSADLQYVMGLVPDSLREQWGKSLADLGEVNLIESHKRVKALTVELTRLESRFEQLLKDVFYLEDIHSCINSSVQRIESTLVQPYR